MPDLEEMTPGQVLADASVADFIRELGLGVAAAQAALDENTVRQMNAFSRRREDLGGRSLLDLGLLPAFYHYQHADISCSMQIRMEVGRSSEFGFGVRAGFEQTDREEREEREETTEETSGSRTETRTARLSMRSDSTGVLSIDGQRVTPTGNNPVERLRNLREQLTSGDIGVDTLIFRPPATNPEMSLNAATDKVIVASPTVTFLRPDSDSALLRLRTNAATDYVVNGSVTVSTTAQSDIDAYAGHVVSQFQGAGFGRVVHLDPARVAAGGVDSHVHATRPFVTGEAELSDAEGSRLAVMAEVIKALGEPVRIEGFADRQRFQRNHEARNAALGDARARAVRDALISHGVAADRITVTPSRGEAAAREAGDSQGQDNETWRAARIYLTRLAHHHVALSDGPDFADASLAPDNRTSDTAPNGFILLWEASSMNLSGNGVTIDGTSFGFSGSAGGGHGAGSAEAHAFNLATVVNAADGLNAMQTGPVVRVTRDADEFDVQLFATTSRELQVDRSSEFRVTEQFRRTSRQVEAVDTERNRTIAVAASVDFRMSRQFNMEVTGNSTISARLVSVPAPPEFIEQIRAFQNETAEPTGGGG